MAQLPPIGAEVPDSLSIGLLTPGTIDVATRPAVPNPDGSVSTVRSIGVNIDGKEVLIPTVVGGRVVSEDQAIDAYKKTGQHLGIFRDAASATAYAEQLHEREATRVGASLPAIGEEVPTPAADFQSTNQKDAAGNATWLDRNVSAAYQRSGIPGLIDVGTGALKGAANTVLGVVDVGNRYVPGVARAGNAIQQAAFGDVVPAADLVAGARAATRPEGLAQQVGYTGEQIGEFFLPTGVGAKAKAAAVGGEMLKSGALTMLQGGSPTSAAVSAGLTGAIPGVAAVTGPLRQKMAGALSERAEKGVMQALGATKERYKAIAARLTPKILQRGLRGSRESLQAKAADTLAAVGQQLDDALTTFGSRPASITPITAALETAKDAFRTTTAAGNVVAFEPRAIAQLDSLQQIVTDLGPTATIDQLVAVRRAWDKVVSQAGGFEHRAGGAIGVPLKDQSEAWAKREATSAIRQVLATEVPELAAINKEWAFWKGLDDVLTQTLKRTQPHGPGLLKQGAEAAGQVAGAAAGMSHGPAGAIGGAFVVGKLSKMAQTVLTSPRYRLASAQLKDALAQAIVSQRPGAIANALAKIAAAGPSQVEAAAR